MVRAAALVLVGLLLGLPLQAAGRVADAAPIEQPDDGPLIVPPDAVLPVPEAERNSIQDWYIVVLRDNAPDPGSVAVNFANTYRLLLSHVYRLGAGAFAAKIPPQAVEAVRRHPLVAAVIPDQYVKLEAAQPPQELPEGIGRVEAAPFEKNVTARIDGEDGPLGAERIDVHVAVLDSGIDQDHDDLYYRGGIDCTGGNSPGTDGTGHGTHVAGTIGALDNGIGVVGVAPGAKLWSVKVLNHEGYFVGRSLFCGVNHVWQNANRYAVANMSVSGGASDADDGNCGSTDLALYHNEIHKYICAGVQAGVTCVVAAGNQCIDARHRYPAAFDEVITVSALTDTDGLPGGEGINGPQRTCGPFGPGQPDDTLANFSNFGADIDIAAPGVAVLSTLPNDDYGFIDGTSMAAPHVAGAAALYLARTPGRTPAQVRRHLLDEAEPGPLPDDPDEFPEPILNVRDGVQWSADGTPPTAPQLTLSENDPAAHVDGTTFYYNSLGYQGVFTVTATGAADPQTGIASVRFPNAFDAYDAGDAWFRPYAFTYQFFPTVPRAEGPRSVRAVNGNGLLSPQAIYRIEPDGTEPTAAIDAPPPGARVANGRLVRVGATDPGGAGVALVEVRYCRGTTCAWADSRPSAPPPPRPSS